MTVISVCGRGLLIPPSRPDMRPPMGRGVDGRCVGGSPSCQSLCVAEYWLCLPNPFSSTSDIQKLWITFQAYSTILVSCFRKNLLFKNTAFYFVYKEYILTQKCI